MRYHYKTDGSEDGEIHCFKPGQPCAAGKDHLKSATENLSKSAVCTDDKDPFASDTDDDELEENETLIDEGSSESDGTGDDNGSGDDDGSASDELED